MAAKKKTQAAPAALLDDLKAAVVKSKCGGHIYSADGHTGMRVGVPLPSLSFEYLFNANIMYLGAMYGLAGPPQSYKSNLALELGRMLISYGGINVICETEGGKISPEVLERIYGDKADHAQLNCVESIESGQKYLTAALKWYTTKHPDKTQLFAMFVDSIGGANSEESHKIIEKEGSLGRAFPVEAMLWTNWIKDKAPKLAGWPVVLFVVNHEKDGVDGSNEKKNPGGVAQKFHSTIYMRISRVRTNEGATQIVNQLQIQTIKHSFGIPRRRINVPFIVELDEDKMYFDWEHSTADLLADKKSVVPRIKDIIHVTSTSDSMTALTRTFSCRELGLTNVSGTEMGAAIHSADPELLAAIRKRLQIKVYKVWDGVMVEPPTAIVVPETDEPEICEPVDEDGDGDIDIDM